MYISYRKEIYFQSVIAANPTEHLNVNDYSVHREKEMATYSSILAWRILWTEKPGGLLSIGSHRVRHDRSDLAFMHSVHKTIDFFFLVEETH